MATRLMIRELAMADGTSAELQVGMDVVVEDGKIAWIGPTEAADPSGAEIIDGGGATLVPALIDCHSHLAGPGVATGSSASAIHPRACARCPTTMRVG